MPQYKQSYINLNNDELMHWKYIKKIPRGDGTFQYIYEENHGLGLKAAWEYSKSKGQKKLVEYNKADNYNNLQERLDRGGLINDLKATNHYYKRNNELKKAEKEAEEQYQDAKANFYNSPIGRISNVIKTIGEAFINKIKNKKLLNEPLFDNNENLNEFKEKIVLKGYDYVQSISKIGNPVEMKKQDKKYEFSNANRKIAESIDDKIKYSPYVPSSVKSISDDYRKRAVALNRREKLKNWTTRIFRP